MSKLYVLLISCVLTCCYGLPTEEEIMEAIDRATIQNTLKRGVASLMATDNEPAVNSCPHMQRNFHGRRTSSDQKGDKRANDLIAAAQLLVNDGHSVEDLQHEDVKRVFRRQTENCPTTPTCDGANVNTYRTADGSCNNVASPGWGQAGQPQVRITTADYADGISEPRATSVLGGDLPNPRTVSNIVHAAPTGRERRASTITLHTFQMGQFLDHDVIATPAQSTVSDCCSAEGKADTGNCLPIVVPGEDARFGNTNYCMNFHRSAPLFCPAVSSQREQINAITSFVDASNVYGSSDAELQLLRENNGAGALLATEDGGNRLPNHQDQTVCISNPTDGVFCSLAGDFRVNVVPSLTAYHTLFVKEHNRIATALRQFYTDDEALFQETRKVLIGVMQKIVYDEFLPAFLSPAAMSTYRLASSNTYTYDPSVNPTVSNGFGIAYRMGHTWIPRNMDVFRRDFTPFLRIRTQDTYENPATTYISRDPNQRGSVNGMEGLAYWLSAVNSPDTDRFVEDAARNDLFLDNAGDSLDLVALNIQRGRDHGLPSYSAFRSFCGLSSLPLRWRDAANGGLTDHTDGVARLLRDAYASPQDIDLFTGALTETAVAGGGLGPTLDCIIGDQFMKLKFGDRFWYQGTVNGFSTVQQEQIQKASMARILCDNFNFDNVHTNAFVNQSLVSCNSIESMDLSVFAPANVPAPNPPATNAPPPPPPPSGGGDRDRDGRPRPRPRELEHLMEELLEELHDME